MHHYTYWLTCLETNEFYIGVRTAKVQPSLDHYWSSSKVVKAMMGDGKTFTKQVLAEWDSREEANSHEILLHEIFNVGINAKFLNKAKHLSSGFCIQGNNEVGAKIAKALTGRRLSAECRAKLAKKQTGRIYSPEARAAISAGQLGKKRGKYNLSNKNTERN
jgi:hypothetical protein